MSEEVRMLTAVGQIKKGDTLIITYQHTRGTYKAVDVLNHRCELSEEVILDKKKNLYFITSMVCNGTSWAKDVKYIRVLNPE